MNLEAKQGFSNIKATRPGSQRAFGALEKAKAHARGHSHHPLLTAKVCIPAPPHQELPVSLREPERGGAGDRSGPRPVRGVTDSGGLRRAERLSRLVSAAPWPPLKLGSGEPSPPGACVTLAPGESRLCLAPVFAAGSVSCSIR